MRRLRGILVSMVLWAVPWAIVGLVVGLALSRAGNVVLSPEPGRLGVPGVLAAIGATIGAANGLLFALLVLVAERRRTADTLHVGRVGLWGAVASGGIAGFVFGHLLVALAAAAVGFGAAAAMASLARRGARADTSLPIVPPTV